jgi:porin
VNFIGPFAQRPQDKLGVGFALARISRRARDLDRDFAMFSNTRSPLRDYESLLSIGYLAEITKGWTLQPSFQYVIHPGAGAVSTNSTLPKHAKNAPVLGLRTVFRW